MALMIFIFSLFVSNDREPFTPLQRGGVLNAKFGVELTAITTTLDWYSHRVNGSECFSNDFKTFYLKKDEW